VAGFVDVDVRTYTRPEVTEPPPLAAKIRELNPRPGDRLLVPRIDANYERPIEVLWPQTNIRYGIATFNGYGPLGSLGSRMLFRFMPWGSSEEMLAVLWNTRSCEPWACVSSRCDRRKSEACCTTRNSP